MDLHGIGACRRFRRTYVQWFRVGTGTVPTASPAWKDWEGRVLDGRFPLLQYVEGSGVSALFLTEHKPGEKAAIRLVKAEGADAERLAARWNQAAKLTHPNLQRVWHTGLCRVDGIELTYLVTEAADEVLAEVLQSRPLTGAETREMLEPLL